MYSGKITDVSGVLVGHAQDYQAMTGVTCVYFPGGAVGGVDVRGGGPGTRETDALEPGRLVEKINAFVLSGGSAFGLDSASGVMQALERKGEGYETGFAKVPIVPAAVLYDLGIGSPKIRPNAAMGAAAFASCSTECEQGIIGAGTGATTGKLARGLRPFKSGIGTASLRLPGGATIGAIVAVNAAGDVYDPHTGELIGGATTPEGKMICAGDALYAANAISGFTGNTTIGVIATDARLNREQTNRLAMLAHDGYARAIRPVHLPVDGDTVFAASTGTCDADFLMICAFAAEVMGRAVANAAYAAREQTARS